MKYRTVNAADKKDLYATNDRGVRALRITPLILVDLSGMTLSVLRRYKLNQIIEVPPYAIRCHA